MTRPRLTVFLTVVDRHQNGASVTMVHGALLFMQSLVCFSKKCHSGFDSAANQRWGPELTVWLNISLQDNNGGMLRPRSKLFTGEPRPSNLISVRHLRLVHQINSGGLEARRAGRVGSDGELSCCTGEREDATGQKQFDPCSRSAQNKVLHRNYAWYRQQFVVRCDFI